jgi:glucoamylase
MPKGIEREGYTRPEKPRRAPGKPGKKPHWSSSAKTAVGTATSLESRVWFTLGRGTINEIYFPDIDAANTRSVRFLVTDGTGEFFCDEESAHHVIEPVEDGVPSYRMTSTCKQGRFALKKEIITDPARDVLLLRVRFKPSDESLRLFLRVDPQVQDKGRKNSAHIGSYKGVPMLFADRDGAALAVAASVPFLASTCGYVGRSDGLEDLRQHGKLTECFNDAPDGNVAMCAEIDWRAGNGQFVIVVGLGGDCAEAGQGARAGLLQDFEKLLQRYTQDWKDNQGGYLPMEDLSGGERDLYRVSAAVLNAHQSKRYPGAYVASLSIPWGFSRGDNDGGGYHVTWPRDLVESAFGKLACGDADAARRAFFYLACTQEEDGHWSQNSWLDGTPNFDGVQLDSTSMPVMLACRLHREGHLGEFDLWPTLRKAVEYLLRNGPCSPQERWEALAGYSVFTMAVEVTALLAAAEVAAALGKHREAEFLHEVADAWNEAIDDYTYATDTELARKYAVPGYYLRIAPPKASSRPLGTLILKVPDKPFGNRAHRAVNVVSPDALMLVRMGLRRADDPRMVSTVKVIDGELKREMSTGAGWVRSSYDGYGEHEDGAPFDGQGIGRCWPLLAGERGHYALAAGDREGALTLLRTMARQTSECGMLPEQVWDQADIPSRGLYNGHPTGSGMPLAWAHAEYVKLLRSLHEGRVWDMPQTTARRYLDAGTRSDLTLWTPKENRTWLTAGKRLQVMVDYEGSVHWTGPGKSTGETPLQERPLGFYTAPLPTEAFPSKSRFEFQIVPRRDTTPPTEVKVWVR